MQYNNLHDLIFSSSSTRKYFLSLPVSTQLALHRLNSYIHSAAELHTYLYALEKYEQAVRNSTALIK